MNFDVDLESRSKEKSCLLVNFIFPFISDWNKGWKRCCYLVGQVHYPHFHFHLRDLFLCYWWALISYVWPADNRIEGQLSRLRKAFVKEMRKIRFSDTRSDNVIMRIDDIIVLARNPKNKERLSVRYLSHFQNSGTPWPILMKRRVVPNKED